MFNPEFDGAPFAPDTVNQYGQPIGANLPEWQPRPLPGKLALEGEWCRLELLSPERHASALYNAYRLATGGSDWTYLSVGPFTCADDYRAYAEKVSQDTSALHYTVIDQRTSEALGTLALMRIQPEHGVIEIGFVAFSPALQRTPLSTEANFLLLRYVFEQLGYRRCEWKCDSLNLRSRRAAERLGFSYEGTFRQAIVYKGRSRDTAWYSMLAQEWPRHRQALQHWLSPDNFNAQGQQVNNLQSIRASTEGNRHQPLSASPLMTAYARLDVAFVHGEGARLWDSNGREYLDAIAGVAVTSLGHAHPEIAQIIAEQSGQLLHTSNIFRIEWQERLGRKLCALSGMERAFFCNSGAEANETAFKLARLYGNSKQIANPQILVMENAFHGRTLATLAATGNVAKQRGFEPLMPGFVRVPYDDIAAIEAAAALNPDIVAVLLEPVQGEGGIRVASPDYLRRLRTLCDQHDWLLMLDEVQSGMGRTGAWFGHQHADIRPDVITLAKALGNGFPIGACLAHGTAAELFSPGLHGSTFGGNPLGCRVACAVLDIMMRNAMPEQAAILGKQLLTGLQTALRQHPNVITIRGLGLMVGIELNIPCAHLVQQALKEQRLLITVTRDTVIRLLPPLICSPQQIDDIVSRISRLLNSLPNQPQESSNQLIFKEK